MTRTRWQPWRRWQTTKRKRNNNRSYGGPTPASRSFQKKASRCPSQPLAFFCHVQIEGWSVEGRLQNGKPRAAWLADDATRSNPPSLTAGRCASATESERLPRQRDRIFFTPSCSSCSSWLTLIRILFSDHVVESGKTRATSSPPYSVRRGKCRRGGQRGSGPRWPKSPRGCSPRPGRPVAGDVFRVSGGPPSSDPPQNC